MVSAEAIKNALNYESFYSKELGNLIPETGGNHKALCPFHEDTDPSLSLNLETGLFKCFGCDVGGDVFTFYQKKHGVNFKVAVVELARLAGVNGDRPQTGKPQIVAIYSYLDGAGNLVFQVVRKEPGKNCKKKDFSQRRPDGKGGWIWNLEGVPRVPYRLPELLQAELVAIVEGEKDADALAALEVTATCNPGGAGKWRKEFSQYFQGKVVFILPDNDPPDKNYPEGAGRAHAQDIARHLHGVVASLKVIELPGLPSKGDISDWIRAGGTKEELLALVEVAPAWEPSRSLPEAHQAEKLAPQEPSHVKPAPPAIRFVSGKELESIEFKDPTWIVPGILPEGLSLLSARPKKGKTWWAANVAVATSTGGYAMGKADLRIAQGKALYLCMEDKLRRMQQRLKTIMGGAPFPEDLILADSWPRLDKGGLEALHEFLKEHSDCKLVVVDSFTKIKPPRPKNTDAYDFDMNIGGKLQALAQECQVCILLVYHNRKTESEDALDDVIGSTGLTGAVDAVIILRRGRGQADGTLFVTGRDVEEQELALKFHPGEGLWELLGPAAEHAISQERKDILLILSEVGPKTPGQLAKIIGNKSVNAIRLTLMKMKRSGIVKVNKEGEYSSF